MKRILVMDEDTAVRESLRTVLQQHNYDVVLATGGPKALEAFDHAGIDLLLLDATFPLRHGWDVYQRVAFRNPPLPIILLDGLVGRMRAPVPAGVRILLPKPFGVPQLLQAIRTLLEESAVEGSRHAVEGSAHRHEETIAESPTKTHPPLRAPA